MLVLDFVALDPGYACCTRREVSWVNTCVDVVEPNPEPDV
jgi:hypothetical protein